MLRVAYYSVIVAALLRIAATIIIIAANPFNTPLPILQLLPTGIICCSLFAYVKLYRDGVPVISLILSDVAIFCIQWAFNDAVVWIPFLLPWGADVLYLIVKMIKVEKFPFEVEGEEESLQEAWEEYSMDE